MTYQVGQQLRQAREARRLSLEQVARATHMRAHYLQSLEAGNFDALPSLPQARGFLRTYAGYLGLDPEPLLAALNGAADNGVRWDGDSGSPAAAPVPSSPSEVDGISFAQANAIFAEVGKKLQQQRELLGLSLDDVVRHTHLRRHYLVALESGDLNNLPSPVQGRGMLNNYAMFLGMEPDPLLLRFAEGLQARLAARQEAQAADKTASPPPVASRRRWLLPAPLRHLFSNDLLLGGALSLFLVLFALWSAIRVFSIRSTEVPTPTAPSIAEVLLDDPTPTTTPAPEEEVAALVGEEEPVQEEDGGGVEDENAPSEVSGDEEESADPEENGVDTEAATQEGEETGAESEDGEEETTPSAGNIPAFSATSGVQIYITVHQRAWMRVTVDGEEEFDGRVVPGSAYTFTGEDQVEVLTGNGEALQVFFRDQDYGLLGSYGQVVDRVFTVEGIVAPTATPTPTVTPTPRVTVTPTPTGTAPADGGPIGTPIPPLP